jgi:hypothetical protein
MQKREERVWQVWGTKQTSVHGKPFRQMIMARLFPPANDVATGKPALSLSRRVTWGRRSGMVHRGLWNEMKELEGLL